MVRRSRYLHYDEQENALMKSSNAFFRALSKDRVLFFRSEFVHDNSHQCY